MAPEPRQLVHLLCQRDLEVMSRHRFVKVDRLHQVGRARRQIPGVDVEHAWPFAVRAPRAVRGRGRRLLAKCLDGADLEISLRRDRELARHRGRDLRPEIAIAAKQRLGVARHEARIAAQLLEQAAQVARVTDLRLEPLHRRADPCDLRQAELVHLLWRERSGRVQAHAVGVPGGTVRQLRQAHAPTRAGEIVVLQVVAQPADRRQHRIAQLALPGDEDPLTVRGRQAGRKVEYGTPEHAFLRVVNRKRGQLRDRPLDHDPGLHHAPCRAGPHVVDRLLDPGDEPVHARKKIVVVLRGRKGMHIAPGADHRELRRSSEELVNRQKLGRIAVALDRDLATVLEGVVGDSVRVAQDRRIHGAKILERFLFVGERIGEPGRGQVVAELCVVAVFAMLACDERVELKPAVVPGVDHRGETLCIRARAGRRRSRIAAVRSVLAASAHGKCEQPGEQQTSSTDRHVPQRRASIQRSILRSRISIGTAPSLRTSRWKSRISNFAPSDASAFRRSAWMRRSPTL